MMEVVDCPYCGVENDMSDALTDLPNDNRFDHECQSCEEEFEVFVEFDPSFSASKIEVVECENCGKETRDTYEEGKTFPFPKSMTGKRICRECFYTAYGVEMEKKYKVR